MKIVELLTGLKRLFGEQQPVAKQEPAERPPAGSLTGLVAGTPPGKGTDGTRCYIVDDEAGIRQLISLVLKPMGIRIEEFAGAQAVMAGLDRGHPQLIFLDISLERSDAVEVLHGLAEVGYTGAVSLMSGRHGQLLEDVRKIGERLRLRMLPALLKPFDVATASGHAAPAPV